MSKLYALLFILLAGSLTLFITDWGWTTFLHAYFFFMMVYIWYTFALLFWNEVKPSQKLEYENETIAILVPSYNEPPRLLKRSLDSVLAAKGNTRVIVIDDGSKIPIEVPVGVTLKRFDKNQGKRHALHYAVTNLVKEEYVITIDSDTVVDEWAFVRLVEVIKNKKVGAVTGDVQLLNENQNTLTRMIGTYYWIGLNIYKKAQSSLGMVVCCSGCLAAYKTSILKKVIDEFVNQTFLGEKCTHSEDRHLTNLVLKNGYDVLYVPEAISYTETPATIKGFLKQQQRWKRGYIRESLYTLSYAWKVRPVLFLQVLLWDLTAPFFTFGLRIATVVLILTEPTFFLVFVLPSWIVFMFIRYMFVFYEARDKIFGLFVYALFYEVFLYWMNIYALFTVKNKSWITR